jgi:Matrixin
MRQFLLGAALVVALSSTVLSSVRPAAASPRTNLSDAARANTLAGMSENTPQASNLEDSVRKAAAIMVGTLTQQEARYGDASKRFIFTDQVFTVEDSLLPESGLQSNQTVRLTFWGGTIGGETQELADMPTLTAGERYVLLLRPEWGAIKGMPLADMRDGLFRVVVDPATKASTVVDANGVPLNLQPEGKGLKRTNTKLGTSPTTGMTLEAFVARLRQELPRIRQTPAQQPARVASNERRVMPTYARPDDPMARIETVKAPSKDVAVPQDAQAETQPSAPTQADVQAVGSGTAQSRQVAGPSQSRIRPAFSASEYADLPIVINQFPSDWSWSPEDQRQMAHWNQYASGVFQVYTTPKSTWAFDNGVFDLAGWPSSDEMKRQFGSTWEELGNPLATTFKRKDGSKIVEADIALNPAFSWTLDDEALYDGADLRSFRRTMTHELGHVWGLEHQFDALSVMNYPPNEYRAFALPFMDDAEGIRQLYPDRVVPTADLGIDLFYSAGYQDWQQATFPASVAAGASFSVSNYQLENVGTQAFGTLAVEWYLTTLRNFDSAYYYLGTTTYPMLDRFSYFDPASVGRSLQVPASVPSGSYYLAAFIRGDQSVATSGFQVNNSRSFSRTQISIFR